jgi:hypothetical protein
MKTSVGRVLGRLVRGALSVTQRREDPRCLVREVRSESDVRAVAAQLWVGLRPSAAALSPLLLRDLVALNTPALFLNIVDEQLPLSVVLRPWDGRSIRMRGSSYLVEVGSEAPEGVEAFTSSQDAHVTALYPTAPDHPLYVISIEQQAQHVYGGAIPSYLTHITIVVNGSVITHCERLLHERGPHVWRAA